ncbi:unnamed protein product [Moneuplotes crassus]|uniref:Uncharacterized protein n=1 Tax=Euplotes crassus TaxID=5936 RepID=A0AAD2D5Y9_EUPCR|nr:unnamed protein product [Moneuplotes crassus]
MFCILSRGLSLSFYILVINHFFNFFLLDKSKFPLLSCHIKSWLITRPSLPLNSSLPSSSSPESCQSSSHFLHLLQIMTLLLFFFQ